MDELSPQGQIFSALILEIFRINRLLLDAGDQITEPVGLSSARWQVLGVVDHGPVPVAHVARTMGLTRQAVQHTADTLEADGLIAYADNPHHRRAKLMTITPQGRAALGYAEQHQAVWANEVAGQLTGDALHSALTTLADLRASLEQHPPSLPAEETKGGH